MWVRSLVAELRSHQTPATTEPMSSRVRTPKEEKPPPQETRALQLEKAHAPQQRPSTGRIFFFFKLKERIIQVSPGLVSGPGCWLLSNTGSAHWPASVPFLSFSSLSQSLCLCVAGYPSSKTYLLWLAICFTLEKDPSTSKEFYSPISFTGFCSLYDTPRNRPDR